MAVSRETLRLVNGLRVAILATLDATDEAILRAWGTAWNELATEWDHAISDLVAASKDGKWPSAAKIRRAQRVQNALRVTRDALQQLAKDLPVTVAEALPKTTKDAADWQQRLTASQLPPSAAALEAVPPDALAAIVKRTSGRVVSLSQPLTVQAEAAMRGALIRGVAVGDNPRTVATDMLARVEGGFNGGKVRALTIARTEMLDAHRAASLLQNQANSKVLTGWEWLSALDKRTCFPAGTLITTSTGQKPIEQIATGDQVLTHTGHYRRAYEPMTRSYAGSMVTVEAGPFKVTSTSDHPFLIERQGELQWIEARGIRRGDSVLSNVESPTHRVDHVGREIAIERGRDQADDGVSTGLHEDILAGVSGGDLRVPVGLIDFEGDVLVRQEEVNGATPASDGVLLQECDTELGEAQSDVSLRRGLPRVLPVAPDGAEPGIVRGDRPEALPAFGALDDLGRSSALFGAAGELSALRVEDRPACLARRVGSFSVGALDRAVVIPAGVAERHGELDPAADACLGDLPRGSEALARAGRGTTVLVGQEGTSADRARPFGARFGDLSSLGVWVLALMCRVTGPGAVPAGFPVTSSPRRWDLEMGSAPLASKFHRHIISSVETHYQRLTVHNFEVEEDHSYVANGLAVHNCPACWAQHGTFHSLEERGPDGHVQCRCSAIPAVRPWKDLGFDIPEPPSLMPSAPDVFASMGREDQLAVMGKTRLDLLDSGQISWSDLATKRSNTGWRDSVVPTPVGDLLAKSA